MILNYRFENCLSFRENVEFSMLAPKSKVKKRFPNNYVETDCDCDVLKTAVIVGENAGGKSNFVRSLEYFKSLFKDMEEVRSFKSILNMNNITEECPIKCNTRQTFEIEILQNKKYIYLYHLEIDFQGIFTESLFYKDNYSNKYKKIFYAKREDSTWNCQNEEEFDCEQCKSNSKIKYSLTVPGLDPSLGNSLKKAAQNKKNIGLFITKLALVGNEYAIQFTDWISESLCPESYIINADLYKAFKNEEEDIKILKDPRYLEIFQLIDYSIIGIELDEEKPFTKTKIKRKKTNGSKFEREISQDSSGVSEFFAWAVQVFKVVYENKTVLADEMDRVLNPVLSDRVISFIHGRDHLGQFIFTTHNVLHLDLKNYMKEQIYFITKDMESLESELYSLADFPEIRYETTKIYEFYMKGILGGTAIE